MEKASQINQNGAKQGSESDLGGKFVWTYPSEDRPAKFLEHFGYYLGDFRAFGAQLGAKGLPKSSFLVQSRAKISKNAVQNEASEKVWNVDWTLVRKC